MAEPKQEPGPQTTDLPQDSSSTHSKHVGSQEEKPRRKSSIPTPSPPPTGILGFFSRMGDLPEWKVSGKHLSGTALNYCIGFIASCGFLMFGYDQGVLSALLTLDDFQKDIPLMTPRDQSNNLCWLDNPSNTEPDPAMCTGDPNTQAAGVAIYQIGCFLGAVVILFYGETWGRKSSTFWGSALMIVGTIMQAAAHEYGLFVAGRVVGGIGNGMVTSTIPTWQSECARPHQRGFLITLSGALISGGIMIAYWVDYGFYFLEGTVRWRFPIAFQSFFTIIVMIGLLFLPDSPRWLAMKGRMDEAREVTSRLLGKPFDDDEVSIEIQAITEALEVQSRGGGFKYRELLTNGPSQNLRRTLLGVAAQFFQQICGINLITYYATFLFENSLGFGPSMSRLLAAFNGTEYFLASLIALPLIERSGRRKLMLFGAVGMMASMAILGGTVSTGGVTETGAPVLDTGFGITATVFLFVFNTFFAIGWLGMTWLYPAEITNLRIRIQANALSTCSNWLSNFLIVMITPPAFANLGYRTYVMFAVFNAAILPCVYLFFPEPKGRSLEELDIIFASAHADGVNPVKRAKEMRHIEGHELESELDKYFGVTGEAAN
ncbi:Sugar transporter-like protein [Hapsidospora chrysogenum ATCC 11550]|uniref:Sugar transporter-like protein n=1 Tax=Hapsidospora chrysogenum (strain ATCC 11550 / CBS 779.69 / DSM 880 / IAM 14645 / JCM 23072 / IMI 49137) TaxID=857340 RepID=A0A086T4I3_HAPC1|nr:Sugar transporter-like protein [Hapsidospora chrysogenum ATCC 11550]